MKRAAHPNPVPHREVIDSPSIYFKKLLVSLECQWYRDQIDYAENSARLAALLKVQAKVFCPDAFCLDVGRKG